MIEVNNLVKLYKGAKTPSVDGISFTVNEGEFLAFLGPMEQARQRLSQYSPQHCPRHPAK